jgi:hypothetical protein
MVNPIQDCLLWRVQRFFLARCETASATGGEYNAALVKRGSLMLWVREEALIASHGDACSGRPGTPRTFSDTAILRTARSSTVYLLTLRTMQALLISMVELLKVKVQCRTIRRSATRRADWKR